MQTDYDYKKFGVLYVDDEERSLAAFARAYGDDFKIFTAPSAPAGLKLLVEHADEIGVLVTDQRMPGENGVWLLEHARQFRPRILRILATAYSDMDATIAAVNAGAIYKYFNKPWDPVQLELTLKHALEFFMVQAERDQLLTERKSVLRERMITNRIASLGLLAAGLNHHIGNRLLTVKTVLDLAQAGSGEGGADSLRDPELLKTARADIEKILGLLADLRVAAASPADAPFADEITVQTALGEIIAGLQPALAARRIEVQNEIPDNLPTLQMNRAKFNRLFELLLKDELAMLPAGSRVHLAAAPAGEPPEVVIRLTDNGPALPPDALHLVLDPFATGGKPSEYGINLMVCFFIVHHHGGGLEASSPAEGGNAFVIRLPLKPEPMAPVTDDTQFLQKALFNEQLWEKLLAQG